MLHFVRRSLLVQLLSVYLLFVIVVLLGGVEVNAVVEQQLSGVLFATGGLLFWLILLSRVIRPLHTLAIQHQVLPTSEQSIPAHTTVLAERADEVGNLARSLVRLERDGLEKLSELRTLLETSNAVVGSLEPRAVVGKIIREVRRLVDVQSETALPHLLLHHLANCKECMFRAHPTRAQTSRLPLPLCPLIRRQQRSR